MPIAKAKSKTIVLSAVPLFYMRVWQAFGLCPISLSGVQKIMKIRTKLDVITAKYDFQPDGHAQQQQHINFPLIWSSVQMLLLSTLHAHTVYNYKQLLFIADNFGMFNDILKLAVAIAAYTVTIIESIWRRHQLVAFLQLCVAVQRNWSAQSMSWHAQWSLYRRMHIYFIVGFIVMVVAEGTYTWEIRQREQWLMFFVGFMPSITICRIRLMQYVCYLELLRIAIVHLNVDVCRLQDATKTSHLLEIELQRLVIIYEDIFRMSQLLCSSTAFSLVSIYVTSYIKLLSDCYWSYWVVYNGDDVTESSLILSTIVNVTLLLISSRNCMNSFDMLVHNVHKIRIPVDNITLARRFQHFGLLLRHQPIVYDAYGLFIVNCTLLSTMLTSITTYMIFFVQFMPIFKNL